eukprot:1627136-Rhodomonas_salina.1
MAVLDPTGCTARRLNGSTIPDRLYCEEIEYPTGCTARRLSGSTVPDSQHCPRSTMPNSS